MLIFRLIYVKMLTIVGILTFMIGKISCLIELSMKNFITSGPGVQCVVSLSKSLDEDSLRTFVLTKSVLV